jgi:hypothetical protein
MISSNVSSYLTIDDDRICLDGRIYKPAEQFLQGTVSAMLGALLLRFQMWRLGGFLTPFFSALPHIFFVLTTQKSLDFHSYQLIGVRWFKGTS